MNLTATTVRAGLLTAACLLLGAASASADVQWTVNSAHGPQNAPPGGVVQYEIRLFNVGDADTSGEYAIADTLPVGVTATAAYGSGWNCPDLPVAGPGTVTCTTSQLVQRAGSANGQAANRRGASSQLFLQADVSPGAGGVGDNVVVAFGGTGEACSAGEGTLLPSNLACNPSAPVVDPTPFEATPAGFGFVPSGFVADVFGSAVPNLGDPASGAPERQAGSHPFELRVNFAPNLALSEDPEAPQPLYTEPEGHQKTLVTKLPPGVVGNPQALPKCDPARLNSPGPGAKGSCPANTQVGTIDLVLQDGERFSGIDSTTDVPVYNMQPPPGVVAALAFSYVGNPVWMLASVDPLDHSVVTTIPNTIEVYNVRYASLALWGVPADPAHDPLRMDGDLGTGTAMNTPFSGAPIRPFLTLPTQCDTSGQIEVSADSWDDPGAFVGPMKGTSMQMEGCGDPRIRFEPSISIQPTSHEAASPTGLDVDLSIPQKEDSFPAGNAATNAASVAKLYAGGGNDAAIVTPNVRSAVTHLPPGMAVNPSAADGLSGCSEAQVGLDNDDEPACPDSSKIGTVEIDSPLMADTMQGFIYQAKQSENPFGSLLAFYTVAEGPGLIVKLAAKVEADVAGNLTTTFTDNPQLAFSHYRLHFFGGQRAALVNPPTCGTYSGSATVTSWNSSLPAAQIGDSYQVTSGPGGKPCAGTLAERPFAPGFDAKTLLPIAGAFSPFALDVSREDGMQELRTIETTLPPGMLGRLAGVPYCSEAIVASISTAPGTGLGERLRPSCPAASLVGHTDAAAGAGSLPFHNPGNVYLTGPRDGAPLSLAVVTPVVAGPLDLGSIVVRADLRVDPVTAQIHVTSDPLPEKIVAVGNGFPLNLRSVRVTMDRDGFTLNPTSCDPMSVEGRIGSLQGASAAVAERFQVGACAALGFKPKLAMKLSGGSRRGENPALRATLTARRGDANIGRAVVALPRSEFLDQAHIRTICTRVQYAADRCPPGSVYGHARVFSPLLDQPLEGPVYLRSSNHKLPDLVASLDGQIQIDLSGRIDSFHRGIRTTFATVPDAPVSKFVLRMKGGKRGLLENSVDLCAGAQRADVKFDGHNGRTADSRPALRNSCGKQSKARPHRRAPRRGQAAG